MTIPLTYLRSSSYGCHEMCEMKFFSEYILGWTGASNMKADKGTIVHKVMELFGNAKKANQNDKKSFHDDETDIIISLDSDVDEIYEHVYNYYTKNFDHHNWQEKDFRECKRWVHKALDFNEGQYDPRNLNIVDVEAHFDFAIPEEWAKYEYTIDGKIVQDNLRLKGTIDLITKLDDNTYEVVDWKTGMRLNWATGEEKNHVTLRKDFQLRLYHYACHFMYPEIEDIMTTINYINKGGPFTICFERKDISETMDMIRTKFYKIQNTKQPTLLRNEKPKDCWKCSKFCNAGMTTFENTNVQPIIEKRYGQISDYGKPMTKCEQLKYVLEKRDINLAIEHMSKKGYSASHYKAPGSTE